MKCALARVFFVLSSSSREGNDLCLLSQQGGNIPKEIVGDLNESFFGLVDRNGKTENDKLMVVDFGKD